MGGRRWVASLPSLARWRLWAAGPMHNGAALGGKGGRACPEDGANEGEGRGSGVEWKRGRKRKWSGVEKWRQGRRDERMKDE